MNLPRLTPITIGFTIVSLVIASRAERLIPGTESGVDRAGVVGGLGTSGGARPITDARAELSPVPPPGVFAP
jgi:hypothetical protein